MFAYVVVSFLANRAQCGCGWQGKRRLARGLAIYDAHQHCARTGHDIAGQPLQRKRSALS